jgi:hypothetical protein
MRRLNPSNDRLTDRLTLRRGLLSRIPAAPVSSTADHAPPFRQPACSIRTALTGRSPTSSSLRRASGSSWLDWPVMWKVPAGSAGQRYYRRMDSSPFGRHDVGDERASPFPRPYLTSPSLRRASDSSGLGALPRAPELVMRRRCRAPARARRGSGPTFQSGFRRLGFEPTLAQRLRGRQQPRRRSRNASWCSPPYPGLKVQFCHRDHRGGEAHEHVIGARAGSQLINLGYPATESKAHIRAPMKRRDRRGEGRRFAWLLARAWR